MISSHLIPHTSAHKGVDLNLFTTTFTYLPTYHLPLWRWGVWVCWRTAADVRDYFYLPTYLPPTPMPICKSLAGAVWRWGVWV